MVTPRGVERDVPLGPRTTLGVGGPAWALAEAPDAARARALLEWAAEAGRPALVLGGGSNVLVADAGYPGLVVRLTDRRLRIDGDRVEAGAGLDWGALVEACVARELAGVECLAGIPGEVGAAPIQNIGAYGQELAETLESVEVLERATGHARALSAAECEFGYRDSRFKRDRDAFVVTKVVLRLSPAGAPALRYPELARAVEGAAPSLEQVRQAVLRIRRGKSMVLDPADPNSRSAGSFFTNPIVPAAVADDVLTRAEARGLGAPPRYPAEGGVKLSAAWLIERAGFEKGYGEGPAGLSSRHCLALVNRGSATARDILRLAATVRRGVQDAFGVTLVPEPVFLGFEQSVDALLDTL